MFFLYPQYSTHACTAFACHIFITYYCCIAIDAMYMNLYNFGLCTSDLKICVQLIINCCVSVITSRELDITLMKSYLFFTHNQVTPTSVKYPLGITKYVKFYRKT